MKHAAKRVSEPYQLNSDVREFSLKLLRGLNTPRSLMIHLLITNGEWRQLVELRVDPRTYLDSPFGAEHLRRDLQATELLRKCEDIKVAEVDPEGAAIGAFWQFERQCARTNLRLRPYSYPLEGDHRDARIDSFVGRVQKIVAEILGPVPRRLEGRFGPGTVYEAKGFKSANQRDLTVGDKIALIPAVTKDAKALFEHYYWQSAWSRVLIRDFPTDRFAPHLIRGNRFTTVNKEAMIKRGICIEGGGNVFLQLGVGQVMRERLLASTGIDLKHRQPLHQQLAMESSLSGKSATVDLRGASDTEAVEAVRLALGACPAWYDLLSDLRSPTTEIVSSNPPRGVNDVYVHSEDTLRVRTVVLEKFSSMGNGFTFELETIIFLAIATAATEGGIPGYNVHVYGDDIIVPSESAADVISALKWFGFTPNEHKTFVTSAFRESCGGDFFMGQPVRPYYMKEFPNDPASWIAVANGLFRRSPSGCLRHCPSYRARFFALGNLPSDVRRCRGPAALGDLLINDHPENWVYTERASQRYFRVWRPVQTGARYDRFSVGTQVCVALLNRSLIGPRLLSAPLLNGVHTLSKGAKYLLPYRGNVSGYRFGRVAFTTHTSKSCGWLP